MLTSTHIDQLVCCCMEEAKTLIRLVYSTADVLPTTLSYGPVTHPADWGPVSRAAEEACALAASRAHCTADAALGAAYTWFASNAET